MLPTQKLTKLIEAMPQTDADLTLTRKGVCSKVLIPNTLLHDNVVNLGFGLNRNDKTIVLKQGEGFVTVSDEIGVSDFTCVDLLFIDSNTACIELKSGSMYFKNAKGVPYGLDDGGHLIRKVEHTEWVKVSFLYEICSRKVTGVFNPQLSDVRDYVMNGVYNITMTHEENTPSRAKSTGCCNRTTYAVTALYTTIALNEFEFTVFEKLPPVKRSYLWEQLHKNDKDEDELLDEAVERADEEAAEEMALAGMFEDLTDEELFDEEDDYIPEDENGYLDDDDTGWFE